MVASITTPATARRRVGRIRLPIAPVVVARSPVLLEIVSHSVLHVGYVGQPRAKHVLKIPATLTSSSVTATIISAKEYYRIYSPLIQNAFHSLGQDPKERSVIVLLDGGLYGVMRFQRVLERILLLDARVPACSFHSSLKLVPMAFPPLQQQPQNNGMLIVQLTLQEAHCLAYAAGHALDFTYQVCGNEENALLSLEEKMNRAPQTVVELAQKQASWIDNDNDSSGRLSLLTRALLQCIDACPREMRRAVVHNMVFVGTVVDPQFGVRAAKQLRTVLLRHQSSLNRSSTLHRSEGREETAKSAVQEQATVEQQQASSSSLSPSLVEWISTLVNIQNLKPLAEHVSVIQLGSLRPDLVAWLGASVWASHWHGRDPESENFQWIRRSSSS